MLDPWRAASPGEAPWIPAIPPVAGGCHRGTARAAGEARFRNRVRLRRLVDRCSRRRAAHELGGRAGGMGSGVLGRRGGLLRGPGAGRNGGTWGTAGPAGLLGHLGRRRPRPGAADDLRGHGPADDRRLHPLHFHGAGDRTSPVPFADVGRGAACLFRHRRRRGHHRRGDLRLPGGGEPPGPCRPRHRRDRTLHPGCRATVARLVCGGILPVGFRRLPGAVAAAGEADRGPTGAGIRNRRVEQFGDLPGAGHRRVSRRLGHRGRQARWIAVDRCASGGRRDVGFGAGGEAGFTSW